MGPLLPGPLAQDPQGGGAWGPQPVCHLLARSAIKAVPFSLLVSFCISTAGSFLSPDLTEGLRLLDSTAKSWWQ